MFVMKINMDIKSVFKNKRGLSTVIATVLIILLVVVSVTIVWTFVKNFVTTQTEKTGCFEIESSDKVTLNGYYTCYNSSNNEVQFSINIKDATIDSLIISITMAGNSRSFGLTNNYTVDPDLRPYAGEFGQPVKLPGRNQGLTYSAKTFVGGKVDSIAIAPVIAGKQCGATDETYDVSDCGLFVN